MFLNRFYIKNVLKSGYSDQFDRLPNRIFHALPHKLLLFFRFFDGGNVFYLPVTLTAETKQTKQIGQCVNHRCGS